MAMTRSKYIHLREADTSAPPWSVMPKEYYSDHPKAEVVVEKISKALMREWFPKRGPVGEDLHGWEQIAIQDSLVALRVLISLGLLSDIDNAKIGVEE